MCRWLVCLRSKSLELCFPVSGSFPLFIQDLAIGFDMKKKMCASFGSTCIKKKTYSIHSESSLHIRLTWRFLNVFSAWFLLLKVDWGDVKVRTEQAGFTKARGDSNV